MSLKKLEELGQELTRKFKEEELALRALTEIINDGFWDWNMITNYEYFNDRFWEILGHDPKGKKTDPSAWRELLHPKDLPRVLENWNEHVNSKGKVPFLNLVRYRHGDGERWVQVLCRGAVVVWEGDKPLRALGTHTLIE